MLHSGLRDPRPEARARSVGLACRGGSLWALEAVVSNRQASPEPDLHRTLSLLSQLGFTVLACILGGFGLGLYLDNLLGSFPVLLIVFLLAGIGCGFWRAYVLIMRVSR